MGFSCVYSLLTAYDDHSISSNPTWRHVRITKNLPIYINMYLHNGTRQRYLYMSIAIKALL
jgi:hypothetical protein